MATVTKTYRGSEYGNATYVATITSNTSNLNITGGEFTLNSLFPTITGKITYSGLNMGSIDLMLLAFIGNTFTDLINYSVGTSSGVNVSWTSGATKTVSRRTNGGTLQTSDFFSSSNKTVRSLSLAYNNAEIQGGAEDTRDGSSDYLYPQTFSFNLSQTVTLDVPPTFSETFSYIDDYSGVPYAGRTTAKIQLSSLHAYYGGDFSGVGKAEFTIGGTTVSKANPANLNVLSIPLNSVGTFTPIVKVTDSRGQVATHTLPAITVKGYVSPSVSYGVERTTSTGVPNDEGVYTVIDPTFTFTDDIATLSAPSIVVTDDSGVAQTVSTTWYSSRAGDGTLSGSVTWESLSSGDTVYGLVSITGNFNTQKSYQIAVTPEDSVETGTTVTQTIGSAFYTVDFLAGGHGIAFGQPSSQTGLFCNMDAHFVDNNSVMRALFDFIHPVGSYHETSDTTFDPNVTWGGTWQLEAEGQVHISAGANYAVSGALTNTTDGGASTVTLTTTQIPAHTHGSRTVSYDFTARRQGANYQSTWAGANVSVTQGSGRATSNGVGTSNQYVDAVALSASHTHDSVGGGGAHNNMQPYIVVNRWHRTA